MNNITPKEQKLVYNLSREEARRFNPPDMNYAWISIGEPYDEFQHISNNILDKCPNLKISFWDVVKIVSTNISGEEPYHPPTPEDAKRIVDFILANEGRNIVINCAAGRSRSGAVALFCESYLDYKWEVCKKRADPNTLLYSFMVKYFLDPATVYFHC